MKTFVLILAILTAQLAAQENQPQITAPIEKSAQSTSSQISKTEAPSVIPDSQTVAKPTAKPAQPPPPQQLTTSSAEQLDEYENKILDRAETFYNNRMDHLLWTMSIIMTVGLAIVGILIPMFLEWQRKRSFTKEMAIHLSQSEDALKKYAAEQTERLRAELTKEISSPISMAFSGLGGLLSSKISPGAYSLMLQSHVLAMKFHIISQCSGGSLTASKIIQLFTYENKGSEITLETLKAVDKEIENMKEDVQKIIDDKKREDMEGQVRELQIYVHELIYNKQQTPPPQSSSQQP